MQNGTPVNIPLTVDLHIEKFSGGTITQIESGSTNVVYEQYKDGRWYATQRPGINQFEDASDTVVDARGRGIYYWDDVTDKYIVNNDTVYKGSYGTALAATMTAGTQRVFMAEVGDYLAIIDQENGEGWYIAKGTPTTLTQITDTDFPTEQTPALSLARGGCELNGKLYVLTTDGDIYESGIEDPTTWGALDFRNAEVESDKGVYLAKHHEHVIAFGTRSLELFQDIGNPTGSTLSPRTDVTYKIGLINSDACCEIGDDLYFIGQDRSGAVGAYMLNAMQLIKISTESLDTFLTTAVTVDSVKVVASGLISGGRVFFSVTLYNEPSDISPTETLIYTSTRQWWGFWDAQLPGVDLFPLVDWAPSTTTRAGEGILTNGDLVTMLDDFNPQDTVSALAIYESGIYDPGIYTATAGSGTAIPFEIITGVIDGGTTRRKRQGDLWLSHTPTGTSENITVSIADEQNATYTSLGTIDASDVDARLNQMGSFRRRNFKVTGSLTEQLRAEKLQGTIRVG